MAIEIYRQSNVEVHGEAFASEIRIRANPEDTLAGSISMEMYTLEYFDEVYRRMDYRGVLGETVGQFATRTFDVNGKTITGADVILLIKRYVADLHNEYTNGDNNA